MQIHQLEAPNMHHATTAEHITAGRIDYIFDDLSMSVSALYKVLCLEPNLSTQTQLKLVFELCSLPISQKPISISAERAHCQHKRDSVLCA